MMVNKRLVYKTILIIMFFFLICGCGTTSPYREFEGMPEDFSQGEGGGFYHTVRNGETLSVISRKYNISVEKLVEFNHIPDRNNIDTGQLIFIPTSFKDLKPKETTIEVEINFIWPVRGKVISLFSQKKGSINQGIDIEVPLASNILATEDGKITFCNGEGVNMDTDNRKIVIVQHCEGFSSVYIYEGELLIKRHDEVKQGQPIFKAIQDDVVPKILHFEIRKYHIPQNPYYFLP